MQGEDRAAGSRGRAGGKQGQSLGVQMGRVVEAYGGGQWEVGVGWQVWAGGEGNEKTSGNGVINQVSSQTWAIGGRCVNEGRARPAGGQHNRIRADIELWHETANRLSILSGKMVRRQ